ncbi:hypothetical protein WI88_34620 [Burkholderia ubonensis]|nr:hypothetical protein WI88_34620 [Burkholderia ubonensis]
MTQDMRCDALPGQPGKILRSPLYMPTQDICNPIAAQCFAPTVEKDMWLPIWLSADPQAMQRVGRIAPKRQEPIFATFTMQANQPRCCQLQVAPAEACCFANACTGIVEKQQ